VNPVPTIAGPRTHTLVAERVLDVHALRDDRPAIVEGPAFDAAGNLWLTSVFGDPQGNRVFRVDLATGTVDAQYADADSNLGAIAFHPDGTAYLADLGLDRGRGRIAALHRDGTLTTVVDEHDGRGIHPDDLVFDRSGTLYFNDMQGNVVDPVGRILRRTPDGAVSLVADRLAAPNGIAFDPAFHRLWVSEHTANRLVTLEIGADGLLDDGTLPGSAITVLSHLSGGEVDSVTVDAAGNVYAAMYKAGRVEILDEQGYPIGTLWPEDDGARYPNTTHVAIQPGSTEAYLVAAGPQRASLFRFEALAPGTVPYSHLG
jgi:lactonase